MSIPKILTICPSIYPEKLEKMMDSFLVTRSKYTNIILNHENKSITKIFNETFEKNPDYDFYFMANDDIEFNTPLWDLKLANKGKISYGNDLLQGHNLCTFPMIDGDIVRALGWLQLPTLNRYCGDTSWRFIGKSCDCLSYHGDVLIKHHWSGCSHPDMHKQDMEEFSKWLPWSFRDVKKVKEALNGISCNKMD